MPETDEKIARPAILRLQTCPAALSLKQAAWLAATEARYHYGGDNPQPDWGNIAPPTYHGGNMAAIVNEVQVSVKFDAEAFTAAVKAATKAGVKAALEEVIDRLGEFTTVETGDPLYGPPR